MYDHVLATLSNSPWAIEPAAGREIAGIINTRLRDGKSPDDAIAAARDVRAARDAKRPKRQAQGLAFIPLYGPLVQRASIFTEVSGLLSTDQIRAMLQEVVGDPAIDTIVLDVDSPGGSVFGTAELADAVYQARQQKRVIAVANSMAASAAYWIASQASELVVTPSGMVGSVGVYQMHVDRSEEMRQRGRTVTFVAAGERKTAGNEFAPLDASGRETIEETVVGYYGEFIRAVARGRNTSAAAVRQGFGRGGMVLAGRAMSEGMSDRVAGMDTVLSELGFRLTPDGLVHVGSGGSRSASVVPPAIARRLTGGFDDEVVIGGRGGY